MKKIIIPLLASAMMFCACSEDKLDIPQKGVIAADDFYKTDGDAESALVCAYQGLVCNIASQKGGSTFNPFHFAFNLCADDVFAAGEYLGDNDFAGQVNEFRYDNANSVITNAYKNIYFALYYSNIVINKFPNPESTTKKRCVAEARVIRAYLEMMAAIGWGTPPVLEKLLGANDLPENYSGTQTQLFEWCAKECEAAVADLDERKDPTDKEGAAKVTKGFANALAGKCWLFAGKYPEAEAALKKVIESKKYELVPGERYWENFHRTGDLNEEKVFELNYEFAPGFDWWNDEVARTTWMESNIWNWRSDHFLYNPSAQYTTIDGWGGCGVPQAFADKFVDNDGTDSYRLKASIININNVAFGDTEIGVTYGSMDFPEYNPAAAWGKQKFDKDGKPVTMDDPFVKVKEGEKKAQVNVYTVNIDGLTMEQKMALVKLTPKDPNNPSHDAEVKTPILGIGGKGLYGQSFWLPLKPVAMKEDLKNPGDNLRGNNFTIMRYAEVLLMYAEACAKNNKNEDAKDAIKQIQDRAGSKTVINGSNGDLMSTIKLEKELELWLEGTRWADMLRWNELDGAKIAGQKVTMLYDKQTRMPDAGDKNVVWENGSEANSRFYTVIPARNAGYPSDGMQEKHKLFPYPFEIMSINNKLKQNPGW